MVPVYLILLLVFSVFVLMSVSVYIYIYIFQFQVVLRTEKHLRLHHGSFGGALGARVP